MAAGGCGQSIEEKASEHPPLVVVIDRTELLRAGAADDPLAYLREHGERVEAPAYEGWFHDMAELYFQSKHRLSLGATSADVRAARQAVTERSRLWLSVYTVEDRDRARRVKELAPSTDELRRFHTEFIEANDLPDWPEQPAELEVAGPAMQAWVRAYPRLIEQLDSGTALVIAWDGIASSDRVGKLAGG